MQDCIAFKHCNESYFPRVFSFCDKVQQSNWQLSILVFSYDERQNGFQQGGLMSLLFVHYLVVLALLDNVHYPNLSWQQAIESFVGWRLDKHELQQTSVCCLFLNSPSNVDVIGAVLTFFRIVFGCDVFSITNNIKMVLPFVANPNLSTHSWLHSMDNTAMKLF